MTYFRLKKGYGLTNKQKAFCDEYLENGFDGYKAGLKAGYSEKRALSYEAKLLTQPQIAEYIRIYFTEAKNKYDAKQRQKVDRLQRNIEKLDFIIDKTIPDVLPIDENGQEIYKPSQFEVGMKAIDLQAKIEGHYAPVKQANLNVNINSDEVTEAKQLLHKLIQDNTKDY